MKQNNGSFDMLHYLKLQHVEDIVKTILYKFRETECEFIISKIRVFVFSCNFRTKLRRRARTR